MVNKKHALLSASGAHRWLNCTPSAKIEANLQQNASFYAQEGTAAHELAELVAKYWLDKISEPEYEAALAGFQRDNPYYTDEMLYCCINYARFIYSEAKKLQAWIVELEVENLDFSNYAPGGFGTGDCVIVADGVLEIIDFKYGKGYEVTSYNNEQMRLYALGALNQYAVDYSIEKIKMTIFQPRINKKPSTEELDITELLDWGENYVKPRAQLAYAGLGEFAPSEDVCKFCKARKSCPARIVDAFD